MSHYRRAIQPGGTFFFTVVAYRHRPWLVDEAARAALREAIARTRKKHPFTIDAWVLMPDHLHCIWTQQASSLDEGHRPESGVCGRLIPDYATLHPDYGRDDRIVAESGRGFCRERLEPSGWVQRDRGEAVAGAVVVSQ